MRSFVLKAFCLATLLVLFIFPKSVFADTLFLSPTSGNYTVGQIFSVRVLVSSTQQSINAISGTLSFPSNLLQVTSVTKTGSILGLWVQEPSFSNTQGTVSFEGVVPNPGFNRINGVVVTINFRSISAGNANLRFTSGSLLANDGYGTDILKTLGTASFMVSSPSSKTNIPESTESTDTSPQVLESQPIVEEFPPLVIEPESNKTISLEVPSIESVWNLLLKFLSIAIPLIALIFFLIHTTKKGVDSVQKLRGVARKDLRNIDRLMEKSFDIIKEDISESIHILERARIKRKLTEEEDDIVHRLRQNLVDAERIIHKEIVSAERDIDN